MTPIPPEAEIKGWEKLMGEPILPEPSDELSRTRLRLLVAGSLAAGIGIYDLHVATDSTLLGLKIVGLTDAVVRSGLFLIVVYLLAHFLWSVVDAFAEWRLRLTGYERTYSLVTENSTPVSRDPDKTPRQATLYSWWLGQAKQMDGLTSQMGEVVRRADMLEEHLKAPERRATVKADAEWVQSVRNLSSVLQSVATTVTHVQVPASLRRFDNWFRFFLRSQLLRWAAFDLILPIAIGVVGLIAIAQPWWIALLR